MPPLGPSAADDQREDDDEDINPISALEGLLAMVDTARAGGGARTDRRTPGQRQNTRPQRRGDGDRVRTPRKCANCGGEHEQRACPLSSVAVADRACWSCGEKGRSPRDCPDKGAQRNAINAIEDAVL